METTTSTFFKKTRRNGVLQVLSEVYLRDDISCGVSGCELCRGMPLTTSSLSSSCSLITILDTNCVIKQIDLLERPEGLHDVVVPSTVLAEVKHLNINNIYTRIRKIIADPSRRFYVFANENHRECHVERLSSESPNDRNDRAIRVVTKWYRDHLIKPKPRINPKLSPQQQQQHQASDELSVVLITDDRENAMKAKKEGLITMTTKNYVSKFLSEKNPHLIDVVVVVNPTQTQIPTQMEDEGESKKSPTDSTTTHRFSGYLEYKALNLLQNEIKKGALHEGTIHFKVTNNLEANIVSYASGKEILIVGRENLNRAVEGDIVAVELLPENQWKHESDMIVENDDQEEIAQKEANSNNNSTTTTTTTTTNTTTTSVRPTGIVVGIIKRKWKPMCGSVDINERTLGNQISLVFRPLDRRFPRVIIHTRQEKEIYQNKRIVVSIDSWESNSEFPNGHFIRDLGPIGDVEAESEAILLTYDVPHRAFNEAEMQCLPSLPWKFDEAKDCSKPAYGPPRMDLRERNICSIDPPGCKDIDDALHCKRLPNGNFEVGVHIADVSYFLREGTALDNEAKERSTTVYLADRRIDMLPKALTEDICSLRVGQDRLTFSVIWEMDPKANIVGDPIFTRAVINPFKNFAYEEAQQLIDDKSQTDEKAESLRDLTKLSRILHQRRLDNGALILSSAGEVRFTKDENYTPIDVELCEHYEANQMVEEWMLAANEAVAKKILLHFSQCAVLRSHPDPDSEMFQGLQTVLKARGYKQLNLESSATLSVSLDNVNDPKNPDINKLVRMLTTRCLKQARYLSSGTAKSPKEFHHYGLAMDTYTHFTSPIRRYADVLVHRLLASAIGIEPVSRHFNRDEMSKICENMNRRHTNAQRAGRSSSELHTGILFKGKILEEEGYVTRVKKNGFLVWIPKYAIESTICVDPSTFEFFEEKQTLQKTDNKIRIRVLDKLKVQINVETNQHEQSLVLKCIEPNIAQSADAFPEGNSNGAAVKEKPKRKTPETTKLITATSTPKTKKQKK